MQHYAEEIDSAISAYLKKMSYEEGATFPLLVTNERHEVPGLPSASVFGRCPRKRELERRKVDTTNPTDERTMSVLFSQGKVIGQMIFEAVKASPNFHQVEQEQHFVARDPSEQFNLYTGTMDISCNTQGHNLVIEVKFTESLELKPHYVLQAYAYAMATWRRAYIVVINRFGWRVYTIENAQGLIQSSYYDPLTKTHSPWKSQTTHQDFMTEVRKHYRAAGDPAFPPPVFLSALVGKEDEVAMPSWECGRVSSQPHIYKTTKKDSYKKGDHKKGTGKVGCPYAGICFPVLAGKVTFEIDLDELGRPVIVEESVF